MFVISIKSKLIQITFHYFQPLTVFAKNTDTDGSKTDTDGYGTSALMQSDIAYKLKISF